MRLGDYFPHALVVVMEVLASDSFLLEVNLIGSMSSSDNRKFNLIHFS